jgi:hypothetical protein
MARVKSFPIVFNLLYDNDFRVANEVLLNVGAECVKCMTGTCFLGVARMDFHRLFHNTVENRWRWR